MKILHINILLQKMSIYGSIINFGEGGTNDGGKEVTTKISCVCTHVHVHTYLAAVCVGSFIASIAEKKQVLILTTVTGLTEL